MVWLLIESPRFLPSFARYQGLSNAFLNDYRHNDPSGETANEQERHAPARQS